MYSLIFPPWSRRAVGALAALFLAQGVLSAQVVDLEGQKSDTPAPAAAPATKAIASEELAPGVRVDVLELKRTSGETVTLKFVVVNSEQEDLELNNTFSEGPHSNWDVAKVALLDTPNKKKYLVMRDSEKNCVCTRGNSSNYKLKGGTSRTLWAKFQAPPATVTKITVEMPGTPPFEDLPITQ